MQNSEKETILQESYEDASRMNISKEKQAIKYLQSFEPQDELEMQVNAADAKCSRIEAALEFLRESVRE